MKGISTLLDQDIRGQGAVRTFKPPDFLHWCLIIWTLPANHRRKPLSQLSPTMSTAYCFLASSGWVVSSSGREPCRTQRLRLPSLARYWASRTIVLSVSYLTPINIKPRLPWTIRSRRFRCAGLYDFHEQPTDMNPDNDQGIQSATRWWH